MSLRVSCGRAVPATPTRVSLHGIGSPVSASRTSQASPPSAGSDGGRRTTGSARRGTSSAARAPAKASAVVASSGSEVRRARREGRGGMRAAYDGASAARARGQKFVGLRRRRYARRMLRRSLVVVLLPASLLVVTGPANAEAPPESLAGRRAIRGESVEPARESEELRELRRFEQATFPSSEPAPNVDGVAPDAKLALPDVPVRWEPRSEE